MQNTLDDAANSATGQSIVRTYSGTDPDAQISVVLVYPPNSGLRSYAEQGIDIEAGNLVFSVPGAADHGVELQEAVVDGRSIYYFQYQDSDGLYREQSYIDLGGEAVYISVASAKGFDNWIFDIKTSWRLAS